MGAKYYRVRKAVCSESEAGTPSRKEVLESIFFAYKYKIRIAGTENLQILNSRRQYLLLKFLPVVVGFSQTWGMDAGAAEVKASFDINFNSAGVLHRAFNWSSPWFKIRFTKKTCLSVEPELGPHPHLFFFP